MGIKKFQTFLSENPGLNRVLTINNTPQSPETKKIVVLDALGFRYEMFGFENDLRSVFLCDLLRAEKRLKSILDAFKNANIEVIAFIDGYHCNLKLKEQRNRIHSKFNKVRKNMSKLHSIEIAHSPNRKGSICSSCNFYSYVSSTAISQMLTNIGITVYRGSGNKNIMNGNVCDIDQDIVKYCIDNYNDETKNIIAILTKDTDFYAFRDLPKSILIGNEFNCPSLKTNDTTVAVNISGYYAYEVWQHLGLQTFEQRMILVQRMGNDFVGNYRYGKSAEEVANEIITNDELKIVTEFYSLSNLDLNTYSLKSDVNATFIGLHMNNAFARGICLHDIVGYGSTLADKLSAIRKCIYLKLAVKYKWAENKTIVECFPKFINNKIDVYENFVQVGHELDEKLYAMVKMCDVSENGKIDAGKVSQNAIEILNNSYLFDGNFVSDIQIKALQMQLEYCNISDFFLKQELDGYEKFRYIDGYPRTKDLTAQWLYLKLCEMLCLHPTVIQPVITLLFDGPLYHYFCQHSSSSLICESKPNVYQKPEKSEQCFQNDWNRFRTQNRHSQYEHQPSSHYKYSRSMSTKLRGNNNRNRKYDRYNHPSSADYNSNHNRNQNMSRFGVSRGQHGIRGGYQNNMSGYAVNRDHGGHQNMSGFAVNRRQHYGTSGQQMRGIRGGYGQNYGIRGRNQKYGQNDVNREV